MIAIRQMKKKSLQEIETIYQVKDISLDITQVTIQANVLIRGVGVPGRAVTYKNLAAALEGITLIRVRAQENHSTFYKRLERLKKLGFVPKHIDCLNYCIMERDYKN